MNRDHVPAPRPSSYDRPALPGLRELAPKRALELLARAAVGRVVHTVGALPAVLPVPFRLVPAGVRSPRPPTPNRPGRSTAP
ncbi:hypothetical protein [Kitasatospora sp. NPDC085464]|uniref:hypothetical protein n=1 Tax=Kitasatospora sp. NPDC085464 TaxID=3364063 RepID=UPI0037C954FE